MPASVPRNRPIARLGSGPWWVYGCGPGRHGRLDGVRRRDLATVAMQCDYGKPRPAPVIQADQCSDHTSVTVLPITSTQGDAPLLRVALELATDNGLQRLSHLMVDKAMTVKRDKLDDAFGHLGAEVLIEIERRLAVFLGIAKCGNQSASRAPR